MLMLDKDEYYHNCLLDLLILVGLYYLLLIILYNIKHYTLVTFNIVHHLYNSFLFMILFIQLLLNSYKLFLLLFIQILLAYMFILLYLHYLLSLYNRYFILLDHIHFVIVYRFLSLRYFIIYIVKVDLQFCFL